MGPIRFRIFFLLVAAAVSGGFFYFYAPPSPVSDVYVSGQKIAVELANTPAKRIQGLSGRNALGQNEGMFFVFEKPDYYAFWMRDMNFKIDIIWIDENKKIVDIVKNATPESYPEKFSPQSPAQYVLEVNAGFADEHKINIGDLVKF